MSDWLFLIVGIALLTLGGEALIRGSLSAARKLKVSPLLTGLVIVGFGTSAPELVVSVDAALREQPDLAIGNVVGSNIGNILLILGLCALITPLTVRPLSLRRDGLTMVSATGLFLVLGAGGILDKLDGLIFLAGLGGYLVWAYRSEKADAGPSAELHQAEADELTLVPRSWLWTASATLLGLLLLIFGSRVLLQGAIGLATSYGVSEAVIGLTVVAVGTSLPELSVSVIAALRRHADVAVGNILGSNIFNLLGILGVSCLLQPLPLHLRVVEFDQWVLLGTALMALGFLYTARRLSRLEGGILLAGYIAYVWIGFEVYA